MFYINWNPIWWIVFSLSLEWLSENDFCQMESRPWKEGVAGKWSCYTPPPILLTNSEDRPTVQWYIPPPLWGVRSRSSRLLLISPLSQRLPSLSVDTISLASSSSPSFLPHITFTLLPFRIWLFSYLSSLLTLLLRDNIRLNLIAYVIKKAKSFPKRGHKMFYPSYFFLLKPYLFHFLLCT